MKYFKMLIFLLFLINLIGCNNKNIETKIVTVVEKEDVVKEEIFHNIEIYRKNEFTSHITNIPKDSCYVGILVNEEHYGTSSELSGEVGEHGIYMFELDSSYSVNNLDNIILQSVANRSIPYLSIKLGNDFESNYIYLEQVLEKGKRYNYTMFYELIRNKDLTDDEMNILGELVKSNTNKNTLVNNVTIHDIIEEKYNFNNNYISFDIYINKNNDINYLTNILNITTNIYNDIPIILKIGAANYDKKNYTHTLDININSMKSIYNDIIKDYPMVSAVIYMNKETENYNYLLNNGNAKILNNYKNIKDDVYYLKNTLNVNYINTSDSFYSKTNILGILTKNKLYISEKDIKAHNLNYIEKESKHYEGIKYYEVLYDEMDFKNKKVYMTN